MSARPRWSGILKLGEREVKVEIGMLGAQADGSALVRSGREVLLVTAVGASDGSEGRDFFPLTVEYRERLAGSGRIPGSFFRRETRSGTGEILTSRLIDRSLRPLFPHEFRGETQVMATLHSYDEEGDPQALAITAASMAVHISDLPWNGPVAGMRVAIVDGAVRLFPGVSERKAATLDLLVSVGRAGLIMVEGRACETPEADVLRALEAAQTGAEGILALQERMRSEAGAHKRALREPVAIPGLIEILEASLGSRFDHLYTAEDKITRHLRMNEMVEEAVRAWHAERDAEAQKLPDASDGEGKEEGKGQEQENENEGIAPEAAEKIAREAAEEILQREIRARALQGRRLDGRGPADIRPISGEVDFLPAAHGSSLFTRGETQALVTCTLGRRQDEQLVEDAAGVHHERFLLHYNFPPYSVGEVRPLRGPGRREVGHGNLARMALEPVLPAGEDFPYTIRIESEITSSNGSSSMATVCGGTLALMDAGVALRSPVAGIAMGLIVEGERRVILSDILGDEDHLGDMDFKVAGTREGVTALQLDNKIGSLPREILAEALEQARAGRMHILERMAAICPRTRETISPRAPQVLLWRIRPARVRDLIGPGGRHIQGIQQGTGVQIDVDDAGRVLIYGKTRAAIQEAARQVRHFTGEPRAGRFYRGRVSGAMDFGVFVELFHGIEGLVPQAEFDAAREGGARPAMGDEIVVKVLGVNREGKLQLSRKAALSVPKTEIEE